MSYTAKKLIALAVAEIGYCEKETNSQLDNPTANAGDGNYTKYARDLYAAGYYQASKQGYAWCDMFVDWLFFKLAGSKEKGEYLECQTGLYGAGCEWSSDCYRRAGRFDSNPLPGDQIFFGKTDAEEHTGIVEKVENGKVYTIEGNSSNKVQRCSYALTSSRIVGYGHPRFDAEEDATEEPETPVSDADNTVSAEIDVGAVVKITGTKYYHGKSIPAWVREKNWVVHSLSGDRVVINKSEDGKHSIMSPVNIADLSLVSEAVANWVPAVGDTVVYNGDVHYTSANATTGSKCKGGKAKITAIYQLGKSKHPYHLIRVSDGGATVYGWVDENTFTKA